VRGNEHVTPWAGDTIDMETAVDAATPITTGPGRRADIELLRVIAILMVITVHVTATSVVSALDAGKGSAGAWLTLWANEASRAGVPVFFAITGWALLRRETPGDARWLRRRLVRIIVPLVAWSCLYVLEQIAVTGVDNRVPWEPDKRPEWLLLMVKHTLLGPGTHGHLWYLYIAIALTLAIWLVRYARPGLTTARGWYTGAALALILPFSIAEVAGVALGWASFGWAIGYAAIGFMLLESAPHRRVGFLLFAAAATAMAVLTDHIGYDEWPTAYTSVLRVAAMTGVIWMAVRITLPARLRGPVVRLGGLTFGVYLVHPALLDAVKVLMWAGLPLAGLGTGARLGVAWLVSVVGSFAVVALWQRSRLLTRILG